MGNILVTGINGFVGKHLTRELHSHGHSVYGVGKAESEPDAEISELVDYYEQCDLLDRGAVAKLPLEKLDAVINLAGLAAVGPSFDNPDLYMKVNVGVLTTIGNLLIEKDSLARLVAVSSGALYDPHQEMPLSEESKTVEKSSPYALSKLEMEAQAKELKKQGLDTVIVRPFNHIGPGQDTGFLLPDLYDKISKNRETEEPIKVGNLSTRRDYTDVRDIAKAYSAIATSTQLIHSTYNVCSGRSLSGEDIFDGLCKSMGISKADLGIDVDKSLIRPNDPKDIYGDNTRLSHETGWSPDIKIEKTIQDFVHSQQN